MCILPLEMKDLRYERQSLGRQVQCELWEKQQSTEHGGAAASQYAVR